VTPHVAQKSTRWGGSAIDARKTRRPGYTVSQREGKRAEEIFGWLKTVAPFRKTQHPGVARAGWLFALATAAYNLVRIRNLAEVAR
jgi:hypothetical protein